MIISRMQLTLIVAVLLHTAGARAEDSSQSIGSTGLDLRARIVESTCAYTISGTSGGSIDFGDFSYTKIEGYNAYNIFPVSGKGGVQESSAVGITLSTDSTCNAKGIIVMSTSGWNITMAEANMSGTIMQYSGIPGSVTPQGPSGCMRATYQTASGDKDGCFPYTVYTTCSGADILFAWSSAPPRANIASVGYDQWTLSGPKGEAIGFCEHPTGVGQVGGASQSGGYSGVNGGAPKTYLIGAKWINDPKQRRMYLTGSALNSKAIPVSNISPSLYFVTARRIADLWGDSPPPPGTVFTGHLTFNISYL